MWAIFRKETSQFFSSITGYIAIIVFLVANGLFLFILPDTSLLDYGYASLAALFSLAPWLYLVLIPAVTMRSFAEELRSIPFLFFGGRDFPGAYPAVLLHHRPPFPGRAGS